MSFLISYPKFFQKGLNLILLYTAGFTSLSLIEQLTSQKINSTTETLEKGVKFVQQ